MAERNEFDIPGVFFFQAGNILSGNKGDFNYRLCPEGEEVKVTFWHGFLCSDLAPPEGEAAFALTREGLEEALGWLREAQKKDARD